MLLRFLKNKFLVLSAIFLFHCSLGFAIVPAFGVLVTELAIAYGVETGTLIGASALAHKLCSDKGNVIIVNTGDRKSITYEKPRIDGTPVLVELTFNPDEKYQACRILDNP